MVNDFNDPRIRYLGCCPCCQVIGPSPDEQMARVLEAAKLATERFGPQMFARLPKPPEPPKE